MWGRFVFGSFLVLFVYGLVQLAGDAFERGSGYPASSSLRADAAGTKLLHDSLAKLDGWTVTRHFRPERAIPAEPGAVLFLGTDTSRLQLMTENVERLLKGGARVVIGVTSPPKKPVEWMGLQIDAKTPLVSKGNLVVMTGSQWQNWELRESVSGEQILQVLGNSKRVTFVESALGVSDQGGIVSLLRRAGFGWSLILLAVAAALYLWRAAAPLLPEREDAAARTEPGGAAAALAKLLRKHVPPGRLLDVCVEEWAKASKLVPRWRPLVAEGKPVEGFKRMQQIVKERPAL